MALANRHFRSSKSPMDDFNPALFHLQTDTDHRSQGVQTICCTILAAWPDNTAVIMTFYYLTFTTSAWG